MLFAALILFNHFQQSLTMMLQMLYMLLCYKCSSGSNAAYDACYGPTPCIIPILMAVFWLSIYGTRLELCYGNCVADLGRPADTY